MTGSFRLVFSTRKTRSGPTHERWKWRNTDGVSGPPACLRRTEPSAALIPTRGQRKLAYVPAARTGIRKRIHEFNRCKIALLEARLGPG